MFEIRNDILKPARYTGIEPNRVMKNLSDVEVRFGLCYPDVYEIGMSYLGHFLLYEVANDIEGVWCERCFAPWTDFEAFLRQRGNPLCTLESRTPLVALDLIGFSLTYELNVTNVLNMLELGGIRLHSQDRERGAIVIGGGPLMLNPRQFEPYFDLIVVGEADSVLVKILKAMRLLKGLPRADVILELSRFDGVYSPLFPKKTVSRQYIPNLDKSYHPVQPPIPTVDAIHNRFNVEISRGCGNGCRFCMAGFGYRPYRERSFECVKEIIDEGLRRTGYEEISLLSLSTGDYSSLFQIIEYVKTRYPGVSVSLPSLKIGSIGEDEISAIGGIARTGFTFALEAPTVELRNRLNKDIDIDDLMRQLPVLKKCGWKRLKLYLMTGFPWEKEEDLLAMKELIQPFRKAGIDVNLSISPFVPKPHTPFQWLPMDDVELLNEKMLYLKRILKGTGCKVNYRDTAISMVEGIVSRGDDRLSSLYDFLFQRQVKLEAWREYFSSEPYEEWFHINGIDKQVYLGKREPGSELAWSFINSGVIEEFLRTEYGKADSAEKTTDCYSRCSACGLRCNVSHDKGLRVIDVNAEALPTIDEPCTTTGTSVDEIQAESKGTDLPKRFTFRYTKYGDSRYLGHIDTMNILLRAIRAAGIRIRMHRKYHPVPKIVLSDALPIGIESMCELIEIEAVAGTAIDSSVLPVINSKLPEGMEMRAFIEGSLKDMVKEYVYVLVSKTRIDGEFTAWKQSEGKYFYIWRGNRIKDVWVRGIFQRIIKIEADKLNGV